MNRTAAMLSHVDNADKSANLFTTIRNATPCPTAFSNYNVAKLYIFLFGYRGYPDQ